MKFCSESYIVTVNLREKERDKKEKRGKEEEKEKEKEKEKIILDDASHPPPCLNNGVDR